jgi:hypothetical protein
MDWSSASANVFQISRQQQQRHSHAVRRQLLEMLGQQLVESSELPARGS